MEQTSKINTIDLADNVAFPCDEIEKGIHFIAQNMEDETSRKNNFKNLMTLLEKTREQIFYRHDLKQGLIYKLMGEYYIARGEKEFARFSFEIAYDLLKNYKSLNRDVRFQLKPLL